MKKINSNNYVKNFKAYTLGAILLLGSISLVGCGKTSNEEKIIDAAVDAYIQADEVKINKEDYKFSVGKSDKKGEKFYELDPSDNNDIKIPEGDIYVSALSKTKVEDGRPVSFVVKFTKNLTEAEVMNIK
ncbi:hypothetical protein [Streptococcus agalactiae]|uniref:hypothetical protein n=1 Tax=Streptococcus agalactiae TaxID=1311 RepID=UPI000A330629|nr:hypothetical protein [Streptococcus agalactiae]OTG44335.1 hypothetical protein B7936_07245 [Streptococcus agalactiae]OTG47875.1 hypothetical protein B7935_03585 [Streptococcus agalactiae]OTG50707.1 hypothetical protein B7932_07745 [Streptococcus agalactiae]OTG55597.1 hypothetical protein B7930_08515 [Streptococcus agalactiae]RRA75879.1 hypothetical protein D5F81_08065 [Streptococcus agalactiae]